jgi:hypothetical protein
MTKNKQPITLENRLSPYHITRLKNELKTLQQINAELGELKRVQEELTQKILKRINKVDEGQCTYRVEEMLFTAVTPNIYSLDTKEYEAYRLNNDELPFINESIKYDINKEMCRNANNAELQEYINQFITVKDGKPRISKIGHIS